jgi:precorrin-3B C17-methyltransferase
MSDIAEKDRRKSDRGIGSGTLYVVGIGPASPQHRTLAAIDAISRSTVIVGYTKYVAWISDLVDDKEVITSGMRQEMIRVRVALERASEGEIVALVSSGDPGIYGMAGPAIEMAAAEYLDVNVEIVPGVTAASAAAAALGAPLMLDFTVISLSDLLVPWKQIRERIDAVARAGLVTVLYNPRSKKRVSQLDEAVEIFLSYRSGRVPAAVVTDAGCENEQVHVTELADVATSDVTMRSVVIITNESAEILDGKLVIPRGYAL